jgi:hypothetical protein
LGWGATGGWILIQPPTVLPKPMVVAALEKPATSCESSMVAVGNPSRCDEPTPLHSAKLRRGDIPRLALA